MNKLALLISILALCLHILAAHGQVIHYQQNFDNLDDGAADGQDGWAVGQPANQPSTIITSAVKHGHTGKSMEVSAHQEVIRDFEPIIKEGIHFLSIWFLFENPGVADNTLHIYMGEEIREWAAGPVIRIGDQSGDPFKVGVHDGGTVLPVGDVRKGEWQHIFEVIDVDDQTYSVYLDSELIAENFSWRNPANHHGLGWLMLGFDIGSGLIGYYDDIVFGEGDRLPFAEIDIKPGSDPNSINLGSEGLIPVAILTTSTSAGESFDFDAAAVDPMTVMFGPGEAVPVHSAVEDVDGDGDYDMIMHFRTQETGIRDTDEEATISGKTEDGMYFIGRDSIRIVGGSPKKAPFLNLKRKLTDVWGRIKQF